jgi:hypothetical protein
MRGETGREEAMTKRKSKRDPNEEAFVDLDEDELKSKEHPSTKKRRKADRCPRTL